MEGSEKSMNSIAARGRKSERSMYGAAGLLAQGTLDSKGEALRQAFLNANAGEQIMNGLIWVVLGILGAIALVVVLTRLFRPRQERVVKKIDLLSEVLKTLPLTAAEKHDVRWLARVANTPEPIAILLTPANFGLAYREARASQADLGILDRMNPLCERLFGEPMPDELPEGSQERGV